tara:strand:- start:210 stop:467 length:258 start_codon:yes stop_codon:yes gene_type:complete
MAGRWLRNKKDGEIYGWNEILAENPLTEEVTEEQAFPEKFMTKEQKSRKPKVNLKTKNIPEKKSSKVELNEEVTKSVKKATKGKK